MRRTKRPSRSTQIVTAAFLAQLVVGAAEAAFHVARIDELMVGYDGDPTVQFLEVRMLSGSQNFLDGVKIGVFDASGAFSSIVATLDHDVGSGANRRWIVGTAAFATASGLTPDFVFAPAFPTSGGGMVCFGKPTVAQESNPDRYVDCISYGAFGGAPNDHTSAPNPLIPNGFSLRRAAATNDSSVDFACADPADPEANSGVSQDMPATTPCSGATTTTTTVAGGTTTTTTGGPAPLCGDGNDDGGVTATDALLALNTSVGAQSCQACRCDVNGAGGITATDALIILNAAVSVPVTLSCPAC